MKTIKIITMEVPGVCCRNCENFMIDFDKKQFVCRENDNTDLLETGECSKGFKPFNPKLIEVIVK